MICPRCAKNTEVTTACSLCGFEAPLSEFEVTAQMFQEVSTKVPEVSDFELLTALRHALTVGNSVVLTYTDHQGTIYSLAKVPSCDIRDAFLLTLKGLSVISTPALDNVETTTKLRALRRLRVRF